MTGISLASGSLEDPDQISLFADNWTALAKPAADRFREACRQVACDHGGEVDPSLVRQRLLVNGELDIPVRQYSALWSTACARGGFLEKTDVMVPITGPGSKGNTNKACPLRRWIAGDPRQAAAA